MSKMCLRDYLSGNLQIKADNIWNNSQATFHEFQRGDTGQGSVHCKAVEDNIYKILIYSKKIKELSGVEIFILSISACFHDIGKIIDNDSTVWDNDHGKRSYDILMKEYSRLGLTRDQAYATALIVSVHNNGLLDDLPNTPIIVNQSNINDIKKLAALFRLSDILDTSYQRAPEDVSETKFYYEDIPSKWLGRQSITGWYLDEKNKIILQAIPKNNEIESVNNLKSLMSEDIKKIEQYLRLFNYPYELGELDIKYDLIESKKSPNESTIPKTDINTVNEIIKYLDVTGKSIIQEIPKTFTSHSSDIEFVLIPAGNFVMGSPDYEQSFNNYERPEHKVIIKNSFYMGKYPVTQKLWEKVMEYNPSIFKGENLPVESVSWRDVQEFVKQLNETENINKYRLPSEAEWEYACRAGKSTKYYFGDNASKLGDHAWYYMNSEGHTHPVGQKKPNPLGLHDMYGNVFEWCQDIMHDSYNDAPSGESAWEDGNSSDRVVRGGNWNSDDNSCRSAARSSQSPDACDHRIGFRLVRDV